jgi:hypothetical protein
MTPSATCITTSLFLPKIISGHLYSYTLYYNEVRTHLALSKDTLLGRRARRSGVVVGIQILPGLHHHHVISPGAPWQNGHVQRLIGTVRRECLDWVLILGEPYLRKIRAGREYPNRPHPRPERASVCPVIVAHQ